MLSIDTVEQIVKLAPLAPNGVYENETLRFFLADFPELQLNVPIRAEITSDLGDDSCVVTKVSFDKSGA